MSGIVGILNLDGAPVDRMLLQQMTDAMAFRGPDAQQVWVSGHIGLGHALLHTTGESQIEQQPASLDNEVCGELWITADARVDAQDELIAKLLSAGCRVAAAASDAELILHAYFVWGEKCLEHLLGDFAFAIWDGKKQVLFCARDHFGVKPFFYSRVGNCLVFGNTLDVIRLHPAISNNLNDLAIADFLLFDMIQDPAITSFADIKRLPAAHVMTCTQGNVSVRSYWELSVTTPIQYKRDAEYLEHFRELLDLAVADRVRGLETAAVMMSGGLDSTTVAASAQRYFLRNSNPTGLRAYTEVFDHLIPHQERHYATLSANALGVPIEYLVSDDCKIFESASQSKFRTPEPMHTAWPDTTLHRIGATPGRNRVVLTGYGADPLLCGRITVHFRELLKNGRFGKALGDAAQYLGAEGRRSRLYLSTRLRIVFNSKKTLPVYPAWLNEDFEKELSLRDRWTTVSSATIPGSNLAVRPEAYEATAAPMWACLFEWGDAHTTGIPVDVRYPFFDLRLVNFLLVLPRLPWCCDKELLRRDLRGVLPDAVRLRRKSPLQADLLVALLKKPEAAWVDAFEPMSELERYIVRNRIPPVSQQKNSLAAWVNLRPLSLNYWLQRTSA